MTPGKYSGNEHKAYVFKIFLLCSFVFLFSPACEALSPIRFVYRTAYIAEHEPKDKWYIKHEPNLLSYGPEEDTLTNGDVFIRLYFSKGDEGGFLEIDLTFKETTGNMVFSPSSASVGLSNGQSLRAAEVRQYHYEKAKYDWQRSVIRRIFEGQIQVVKGGSYWLVFNHPVPPVEDEVVLYLNDALESNGSRLNIPPIHFRKNVQNVYRFGCFQ